MPFINRKAIVEQMSLVITIKRSKKSSTVALTRRADFNEVHKTIKLMENYYHEVDQVGSLLPQSTLTTVTP